MKQQEATFGLEHQLNDVIALSARYVHKQIDRAIEDTGRSSRRSAPRSTSSRTPARASRHRATSIRLPLPSRSPFATTTASSSRPKSGSPTTGTSGRSYLWSRLYGNYSGLSQSDENGRTSPNVGRLWDYPLMMFQDGGIAALGPLATDRPHQLKAAVHLPVQLWYEHGREPVRGERSAGLARNRYLSARTTYRSTTLAGMSDGRTPTFSQTDMLVQHGFRIGGGRQLQVSFNVLNLFNQDTAVSRNSTYQNTRRRRL